MSWNFMSHYSMWCIHRGNPTWHLYSHIHIIGNPFAIHTPIYAFILLELDAPDIRQLKANKSIILRMNEGTRWPESQYKYNSPFMEMYYRIPTSSIIGQVWVNPS